MEVDHIEEPVIPQHSASLSHVISLRASFHMHGFDCCCEALSVTLHTGMSADYVITSSIGSMKFGRHFLINGAEVFSLDGRHVLKPIQELQVDGDVGSTLQYLWARLIVPEDRVPISDAEGTEQSRATNKVTRTVSHDSLPVNHIKTILNFAIAFEKGYNYNFAAVYVLNIVKDIICSSF